MSDGRGIIGGVTPDELLAFEARFPRHSPSKGEEIRRQLKISEARYYQLLLRAAASEEGIAAHPITARRVRDVAEVRAGHRESRTRRAA